MYPQSIKAKNDLKKLVKKPSKNCPKCGSNSISKNGLRDKVQRFKCTECSHRFQPSKRPTKKATQLVKNYLFKNSH